MQKIDKLVKDMSLRDKLNRIDIMKLKADFNKGLKRIGLYKVV